MTHKSWKFDAHQKWLRKHILPSEEKRDGQFLPNKLTANNKSSRGRKQSCQPVLWKFQQLATVLPKRRLCEAHLCWLQKKGCHTSSRPVDVTLRTCFSSRAARYTPSLLGVRLCLHLVDRMKPHLDRKDRFVARRHAWVVRFEASFTLKS